MIRLDIFELHTLEGSVPVIQFSDRTSVFRLGKLNSDDGSEPVRLIEDRTMYSKLLEVLIKTDVRLPPRSSLLDRSMLTKFGSDSILGGIVPAR